VQLLYSFVCAKLNAALAGIELCKSSQGAEQLLGLVISTAEMTVPSQLKAGTA